MTPKASSNFTETGCVDCGNKFTTPVKGSPMWELNILDKPTYHDAFMDLYWDKINAHFIIYWKPIIGNDEPAKVFMSCQPYAALTMWWGQKEIKLFVEGRLKDMQNSKEAAHFSD